MNSVKALEKNNDVIVEHGWFVSALLYLVVDYGRPQDILPIGMFRPGLIIVLILIYYIVSRGGISRSKSDQTRMITYFALLTAVYIPFAKNGHWAFSTTQTMLLYMPFFISIIICANSISRLKVTIMVAVGLMIYISIYSFLHKGMGSGNYFKDENDLSLYINMWLPFCYFLFLYEKTFRKKLFFAFGLIVGLIAVVVSFSRGGFVGLVCMFIVVWLVSPHKIKSLVLVAIISSGLYFYTDKAYKAEMDTISDTSDGTANERILSWKAGWRMFIDNPLGVGGNNFQYRFPEYQADDFKKSMYGRAAHSLWFTLLPELGVVGVFIYFLLIYYNIRDIRYLTQVKSDNDAFREDNEYLHSLSYAFAASLVGFFVSGTFVSVLYYAHFWYLTAFIVAAKKIAQSQKFQNTEMILN